MASGRSKKAQNPKPSKSLKGADSSDDTHRHDDAAEKSVQNKSLDSVDPQLQANARKFLQRIADRHKGARGKGISAAAEVAGVQQGQVSAFLSGGRGLGIVKILQIAESQRVCLDVVLGRYVEDPACHAPRVDLRARLALLLQRPPFDPATLSCRAGLPPTRVAEVITDGYADILTLDAIAKAAHVELAWLLSGKGPMEMPVADTTRWAVGLPRMQAALMMALDEGLDAQFIERWAARQKPPDRSAAYWLSSLREDYMRAIRIPAPIPSEEK